MGRRSRSSVVAACCLFVVFLPAAMARAQAWLPPGGEAFISVGYSNVFITKHYLGTATDPGDNVEKNRGHVRSHTIGADLGYAVTDRFTLSFGLPFTEVKWYRAGGIGNPHDPSIDDGTYHGTFQDYHVRAFYQVVRSPLALTPFIGVVIPSHDYQYFAHAAVGRDLQEYLLGVNLGGRLDRVLPNAYLQARYSYAFVERVLGIRHDRSNAAVELGYFVTPSLGARFLVSGFYTHGGLVFRSPVDFQGPTNASNPIFLHHDQIGHDSGLSLGGGLSYALTGSVDVYATYSRQVMGRGGHKIDHELSFGMTYGFSPGHVVRRLFGPRTSGAEAAVQP
jgi:opacity protein-like surface antigen